MCNVFLYSFRVDAFSINTFICFCIVYILQSVTSLFGKRTKRGRRYLSETTREKFTFQWACLTVCHPSRVQASSAAKLRFNGQEQRLRNQNVMSGHSNKGVRPTLWDKKFALDVFCRCSKQMKGQRTDQDEVSFGGRISERRPIEMQICHEAVKSASPTHSLCPEM